jgi:phenylacetate-coenzyme A ligase PaaK-like adenylate-forming protein
LDVHLLAGCEITDRVAFSPRACPCGRPFRLEGVEGRREGLLRLPGTSGEPIVVHPIVIYEVLDGLPVQGWAIQFENDALAVRLVDRAGTVDCGAVARSLGSALRSHGAVTPRVRIERVERLPRPAAGKRSFIDKGRLPSDVAEALGRAAGTRQGLESR